MGERIGPRLGRGRGHVVWCGGALVGASWPDFLLCSAVPPYGVDCPLCQGAFPALVLLSAVCLTRSSCLALGAVCAHRHPHFPHAPHSPAELRAVQPQAHSEGSQARPLSTVKFHEPLGQGELARAHRSWRP